MIRTLRFPLLLAIALLSAAVLVACGGDDDDGDTGGGTAAATIAVTLNEWALEVDEARAQGGKVTFAVSNKGTVEHDFIVIRSDLAADALPTAGGAVDETQVEVVGRAVRIRVRGVDVNVSLDLAAGSYVLICNIPAHYDRGQRIAFTME